MKSRALLLILDGWGHGKKDGTNAIYNAQTPFIDSLYETVPNAELRTDGENVGLPAGQMGNSEVGHLNIGAGRIVHQDLGKINEEILNGAFHKNETLLKAIRTARDRKVALHLIGLVSDGGIHSSQSHLHAILDVCKKESLQNVYVHAFTDGRDTDPTMAIEYIDNLLKHMHKSVGQLASVMGRYYAMDRDKRWERIKKAYDLLVNGIGEKSSNVIKTIQNQYNNEITDEFLEPISIVDPSGDPLATIKNGDVVLSFNYRTDRCRQISEVLTQKDYPEFDMYVLDVDYYTMTRYDKTFKNVNILYLKDNLKMTLGEVVSEAGLTQVRMAETEKYPHVTYFFSGGREEVFKGESRIMANSPKVATYDLQPEMSAAELKNKASDFIKSQLPDLVIINFANPDMVGHTGVVEAIQKAVTTVDTLSEKLCKEARELGYEIIIIADHGNAELNINEDGSPHTSHTTNPVPVFYLGNKFSHIKNGILADVAPSILDILEIEPSKEMTGISLLT